MSLNNAINDFKFTSTFSSVQHIGSLLRPTTIKQFPKEKYEQLKDTGFVKVNKLLSDEDLISIRLEISKILEAGKVLSDGHFEKRSGNLKIKHLQNYSLFLQNFRQRPVFKYFSLLFYGWYKRPTVLYSITTDSSNRSKFVSGRCDEQIASEAHIDSHKNYLKIIILLSDVGPENGPTTMVNKSTTHPIMRSHYHEKATKNASELISQIEAMKVAEDCGTTELLAKQETSLSLILESPLGRII